MRFSIVIIIAIAVVLLIYLNLADATEREAGANAYGSAVIEQTDQRRTTAALMRYGLNSADMTKPS